MQPGDFVRIQSGPFAGMTGTFLEAHPDGRWVLVRLTAWERAVSVRPEQVERAYRASEQTTEGRAA